MKNVRYCIIRPARTLNWGKFLFPYPEPLFFRTRLFTLEGGGEVEEEEATGEKLSVPRRETEPGRGK